MRIFRTKSGTRTGTSLAYPALCTVLCTVLSIPIGSAWGQSAAPASSPVYVVTYYETTPGPQAGQTGSAPTAAFTRYADSTAIEPGAVSLQVLDDAERPSRYVVLEVWQNTHAFQQHRLALSTRQLGQDIAPWLNGPPDQRIHTRFE